MSGMSIFLLYHFLRSDIWLTFILINWLRILFSFHLHNGWSRFGLLLFWNWLHVGDWLLLVTFGNCVEFLANCIRLNFNLRIFRSTKWGEGIGANIDLRKVLLSLGNFLFCLLPKSFKSLVSTFSKELLRIREFESEPLAYFPGKQEPQSFHLIRVKLYSICKFVAALTVVTVYQGLKPNFIRVARSFLCDVQQDHLGAV